MLIPVTTQNSKASTRSAPSRWSGADYRTSYPNPEDRHKLDRLMGMALLDDSLFRRLVHEHDESVMTAYALSTETRDWLRGVHATSLKELAQAIAGSW